jgi:cell shape-determining protein MreC
MNYLLDKKIKRKSFSKIILGVFVLFLIFYFRAGIFNGLSFISSAVFRPVLVLGRNIGGEISNISAIFHNRKSLMLENEDLQSQILASQADRTNYAGVVDENNQMKEILGRKPTGADMILAGILNKPNQSLYDTLLIDAGTGQGVITGQRIFALGNIPIGYVSETYVNSAKVILFSNPGEKTEAVISGQNVSMQTVGRGGGNFEMILPRDFVLAIGTEVDLPGVTPYILGTVQSILSDPRDAFQKALIASPINIQEQKFVEVEK